MNDVQTEFREADGPQGQALPFLEELGSRLHRLRMQRGMTRRDVCKGGSVSERYLANLERGAANPSIVILQQLAVALDCSLAEVVGDVTTSTPEWLFIRNMLETRSADDLRRASIALDALYAQPVAGASRATRISLVGLRGAGKSTLGRLLADKLDVPFVELSREVERHAGCSLAEIHALYGVTAYRRYERRALDEVVQLYTDVVIATPGGVVSDPSNFNQLLHFCTTVWLRASPQEHMQRVLDQGDTRPMADQVEAMDDLKRILSSRSPFYAKADLTLDTSGRTIEQAIADLDGLLARR